MKDKDRYDLAQRIYYDYKRQEFISKFNSFHGLERIASKQVLLQKQKAFMKMKYESISKKLDVPRIQLS